ncbi:glycoside hydrolase [Paraphoma chrysanthemicola]|nr:glycoside hydrolase [Paraphoma chrysanthemicola]
MPAIVSSHAIMQAFNGLSQGRGIYMPTYDGPIQDVNANEMACNGAPNYGFRAPNTVIDVQAGQEITGAWLHTLTSTGPDSSADNKVIDSSHKGPVMVYMKKVDNALNNPSAGPGNGWFKIAHAGYQNGRWAVDDLISAGGIQKARIPQCIANGEYLIRFELLALHSAHQRGQAQFYMACVSARVSGGTGAKTPSTVSIPGTYKADDAGVFFNVWSAGNGRPYPNGNYPIPGPSVFTC